AASPDQKEIEGLRPVEHGCERPLVQLFRVADRPRPDAIGKAKERASMRHPAKAKSAIAIGIDRGRLRQMRRIGPAARRHYLSRSGALRESRPVPTPR